jgi:hypothetical protein
MLVLERDTRLLSDGARGAVVHPSSGEANGANVRLRNLTSWLSQELCA